MRRWGGIHRQGERGGERETDIMREIETYGTNGQGESLADREMHIEQQTEGEMDYLKRKKDGVFCTSWS